MIDPQAEQEYIQLALDHPYMKCSEAPVEILQASAYAEDEPTPFLREFFAAGYLQRLSDIFGRKMDFDQELVDRAVYLLWIRACGLYTSYLSGRPDPDWESLLFSDEGFYDWESTTE